MLMWQVLLAITTWDDMDLCSRFDAITHLYVELTFNLVYILKKNM